MKNIKSENTKKKTVIKSSDKKIIETYDVVSERIRAKVKIIKKEDELSLLYKIIIPTPEPATEALLEEVRTELIKEITLTMTEMLDIRSATELKEKFYKKIYNLIKQKMPNEPEANIIVLAGQLLHNSFGLGKIEFLISDPYLEEIVINSSGKPMWVFHKSHGWLKTNINIDSEAIVYNYASSIARKVGRQINVLDPLLDAHLVTGDRVNATLFPISSIGNTITIRKFRRKPWTIPELVENNTLSSSMAAFIWLCIQFEVSVIFSGGTGSGKTTLMNAALSLLPANQRVISIEDTREINLPEFLHWIPLTTREANPEGKGEINMLDLLINSLRMRPDYIVVGEIRRGPEAQVLFEAIHTGHTVYSTLHANTAIQTVKRLTHEPINISPVMIESLPLVVVMFRDRKKHIRRVLEISEIYGSDIGGKEETINLNDLWKWNPRKDNSEMISEGIRFFEELKMHTGMSKQEIDKDLKERKEVIDWMVKHKVHDIKELGKIVNTFYIDRTKIFKRIRGKTS